MRLFADVVGFRLTAEQDKLTAVQVQVQAAETLLRDKQQLGGLIDMVAKQRDVIADLQAQIETEARYRARYNTALHDGGSGSGEEAADVEIFSAESQANTARLDLLRFSLETELGAFATMQNQVTNGISGASAQDKTRNGSLPWDLLESLAKKGHMIERLQVEVAGLTAQVEVAQRAALRAMHSTSSRRGGVTNTAARGGDAVPVPIGTTAVGAPEGGAGAQSKQGSGTGDDDDDDVAALPLGRSTDDMVSLLLDDPAGAAGLHH